MGVRRELAGLGVLMADSVLLVDDDGDTLDLLVRLLRREPYSVLACNSGADALEILSREEIAVLVVDERMPGLSGSDLLAEVCVTHPRTVRMMLTGTPSMEVAMRAINQGHVFRFLQKPIHASDLRAAIREALFEVDLQRAGAHPSFETRRAAALAGLERQWQGVTRVERDTAGVVLLAEEDSLDDALQAATAAVLPPPPRAH